jgi:type II secretory pathway component GspD/PulD (secretin)
MRYFRGLLLVVMCVLLHTDFIFAEVSLENKSKEELKFKKEISIDFFKADLKDVLKVFTKHTGINFIVDTNVDDLKISLFLDKVTVKDALNSITAAYNLDFKQIEDTFVFRVMPKSVDEDIRITKVYKLKYIKIAKMVLEEEDDESSTETTNSNNSQVQTRSNIVRGGEDSSGAEGHVGLIAALSNIISSQGVITIDDRTNTLVITDLPEKFDAIEQIIESLDKKLDQVLIKVEIIELQDTLEKILGVEYGSADGTLNSLSATSPTYTHGFPWNRISRITEGEMAANRSVTLGTLSASTFSMVLKAIENSGKSKYLSRPRILTLDGEPAIVNITANTAIEQTLIVDQDTKIEKDLYERESTGITLRVTPYINGRKEGITLFVEPTEARAGVSEFFPTDAVDVYTRKVRTKVRVQSGETVTIGGLFSKKLEYLNRKVPILGDIPLLGSIFSSKDRTTQSTELLIFITPCIIDEANIDYIKKKPEDDWTLDADKENKKVEKHKKRKTRKYKKRALEQRKSRNKKDKYKEIETNKDEVSFAQKTLDEKLIEYEKVVSENPKDVIAHSNLGVAYAKAGKYNFAIEQFKKAVILDPSSSSAYNNLGNLYRIKQEYKAAITCLKKTIQLSPKHPYAYTTLGLCYEMRELLDEAKTAYINAIKYAEISDWTNIAKERLKMLECAI